MIRLAAFILLAALAGCPEGTKTPQEPPKAQATDQAGQAADTKASDAGTPTASETGGPKAGSADSAAADKPAEPPAPDPQAEIIGQCMLANARITKTPSGGYACVGRPKDAGKHCTNATECPNSVCLAESQTCTPLWPLYGCYDILSGVGNRMKYCRE